MKPFSSKKISDDEAKKLRKGNPTYPCVTDDDSVNCIARNKDGEKHIDWG